MVVTDILPITVALRGILVSSYLMLDLHGTRVDSFEAFLDFKKL